MIVCFGGAFNPPTKAHLAIYYAVKKEIAFKTFIFMPVSDHYPKPLVASHHRIKMLEAMTEGLDDVIVDPYETTLKSFKGTYHTLDHLSSKYQDKVVFVCGMDQAITMDSWIESKKLKRRFDFIILTRQGFDVRKLNETISPLKMIPLNQEISSSQFRKTKNPALLEKKVYAYIKTHHLYEEKYV